MLAKTFLPNAVEPIVKRLPTLATVVSRSSIKTKVYIPCWLEAKKLKVTQLHRKSKLCLYVRRLSFSSCAARLSALGVKSLASCGLVARRNFLVAVSVVPYCPTVGC